jgi:hypothetical protein
MPSRSSSVLLRLAGPLIAAIPIFAQSDLGSIEGVVRDPSSSAVPNASVTLTNQESGAERKTKSGKRLPGLLPRNL